jgi:superkiller protein 3
MSHLLEILGRGLLAELAAAFRDLLYDDGQYSADELYEALQRCPNDPSAAISLGARHLAVRKLEQARKAFAAALQIDPQHLVGRVGLACVLDEMGDTGQAIEQLNLARKDHPGDATVLFALGFCNEKWGRTEEAEQNYLESLEIAPTLRNAHERLAAIHLKQHRLEHAIEHYEQICWHEPGEISAALTLANLLLEAGRPADAVQRYRFALTIEPDNWEVLDDLVAAYEQAEMYDQAIEQLAEMIRCQPEKAEHHLRMGDLQARSGNYRQARTEYKTGAELNPDYLEAAIKSGTSCLRQGQYEEAGKWFSRAVEINDRTMAAFVGLGVAQLELGRPDEANASFEMAADVEPNSTLLFSETARLHLQSSVNRQIDQYLAPIHVTADLPATGGPVADLVDRQIERHRAALAEHPNYADLHYRLGLLLKHRGDVTEAIDCFRQATAINPSFAKGQIQLGLSLHANGQSDEAIKILQGATQADHETVDLHYQLGLIFADRRQFAQAIEQFELAMAKGTPNIDFHANLALALQNIGLVDRAEACWEALSALATESFNREDTHPAPRRHPTA